MALIDVQEIGKSVATQHGEVEILRDVSFSVDDSDFIAIVGPSGCGKSTLLRLIQGLDRASTGEVLFKGTPVTSASHNMAMVFQSFALFPWLTVKENVTLGLEAMNISKEDIDKKAEKYIGIMGLVGFEGAYPRELSGGMRQRVGLARALIVDPTVLLMDEPFSALDPLTAEALRDEVLQLWQEPGLPPDAVLLVTHNIEEALLMANRLIILSNRPGTILAGVPVKLPRPRDRKSQAFYEMVDYVYALVTEKRDLPLPPK
jgi:NitT/TauT family transport system ATP-binding protein